MLIDQARIRRLIPHCGTMCLLDRVTAWDAKNIQCRAVSHRDSGNPLRRNGRLSAICGVEYAAQAMALHGALNRNRGQSQRAGYLASLRNVACHVADLATSGAELTVEAKLLLGDGNRVIYAFRVHCNRTPLVSGRAAVVLGGSGARG